MAIYRVRVEVGCDVCHTHYIILCNKLSETELYQWMLWGGWDIHHDGPHPSQRTMTCPKCMRYEK